MNGSLSRAFRERGNEEGVTLAGYFAGKGTKGGGRKAQEVGCGDGGRGGLMQARGEDYKPTLWRKCRRSNLRCTEVGIGVDDCVLTEVDGEEGRRRSSRVDAEEDEDDLECEGRGDGKWRQLEILRVEYVVTLLPSIYYSLTTGSGVIAVSISAAADARAPSRRYGYRSSVRTQAAGDVPVEYSQSVAVRRILEESRRHRRASGSLEALQSELACCCVDVLVDVIGHGANENGCGRQ
ncbi:hypothetical protein R3P38DRAFT_2787844 [Favolaschia claudopus]|uniref:Uncharacterized protein n=1 Tax=Favolaschia claudopus TaxID=2862362 RepID=A0AAW0AM67_9AGAR